MTAEFKAQIDVAKARLDDAFGDLCVPEKRDYDHVRVCCEKINDLVFLLAELERKLCGCVI